MWYGALCNHWVMEPERDKDVPNKHNPHALSWSNALHHHMCVCPCLWTNVEEWWRKTDSVCQCFWVCLVCEWLVSESVVPVCHCLKGLGVCECCSSSPPLCFQSLLPLLSPAQHLLLAVCTEQGVSKQLKATQVLHIVFVFSSSVFLYYLHVFLILNSNELYPKLLFVCTWLRFIVFFLFMHFATVNVKHHQCVCCCAAVL